MARQKEGHSQIIFYLREEVKEAFKIMAVKQGFTMSDWLANKVLEAVVQNGFYQEPEPNNYESLAELVKAREEELLIAEFPQDEIDKLKAGEPLVNKVDLLDIAIALGISAEDIKAIYQKSNFKETSIR